MSLVFLPSCVLVLRMMFLLGMTARVDATTEPATVSHGPGLIGTYLNVLLYGVMVSQTWMYFTNYPK